MMAFHFASSEETRIEHDVEVIHATPLQALRLRSLGASVLDMLLRG